MEIYSSLLLEAAPVPEEFFLKQKIPPKKQVHEIKTSNPNLTHQGKNQHLHQHMNYKKIYGQR